MTTKSFTGFLILNWKTGKMTVKKRKGNKVTPYDICIDYNIEVDIPDLKPIQLAGKFSVPEIQVKQAVLEEL